jgi:hypothetical protein
MGGKSTSSTTQTQNSTTTPWAPTQPFLNGILGQLGSGLSNTGLTNAESGALNTTEANAANYGLYSPMISDTVNSFLGGGNAMGQAPAIQANLDAYKALLTPYANGSMIGANSALKPQLDTISNDVTNNVNSMFAGAGRDMSGINQQALARGIAQGEAPVIANQYNTDVDRALNASGLLYGAGNTTSGLLSGLSQQDLQNRAQGIGLAPTALSSDNAGANAILAAEAQRRGIPLQTLGLLANIGVPIAGLGHQTSGTNVSQSDNQMSGADQFGKIAGGLDNVAKAIPGIGSAASAGLNGLSTLASLLFL